jgi:predicted ribosomally synthesized peptide with SipW-like signal peptide
MALVLALGSLGVGYAMWSDTVVINGTVETGSVDIVIESVSSTFVYKDLDDRRIVFTTRELTKQEMEDWNKIYVASANTTYCGQTVTMVFDNIFPTPTKGNITGDVMLHYMGSIPAHIDYDIVYWGTDLSDYLELTWDYVANPDSDRVDQDDINPEDIQLHYCDHLYLEVYLDPQALQDNGVDAQNIVNSGFDIELMVHQWNEEPQE